MKVKADALYSHLANGDEVKELCGASLLLILTALSWYFRPADRKIISVNQYMNKLNPKVDFILVKPNWQE